MKIPNTEYEGMLSSLNAEEPSIIVAGKYCTVKPGLFRQILEFWPIGSWAKAEITPQGECVALVALGMRKKKGS